VAASYTALNTSHEVDIFLLFYNEQLRVEVHIEPRDLHRSQHPLPTRTNLMQEELEMDN
jgi:hypothetical protein